MSISQELLHGDQLLSALTDTALAVHQGGSVSGLLAAARSGLESLGFEMAVLALDPQGSWVKVHTALPHLEGLRARIVPDHPQPLDEDGAFRPLLSRPEPVLVRDVRSWILTHSPYKGGAVTEADLGPLPDVAVLAPLHVRRAHWAMLVLLHDGLREEDLGALRLFALQLGSALDVAEGREKLERRHAELELVHELAISGPSADSSALTRRALETLCRTSESDCGVLHRIDARSGEHVLVGDALGYSGPLLEQFRRFKLDADHPLARTPLAFPTASVPVGSAQLVAEGLRHIAILPLNIEGKAVGMLTLARKKDAPFSESDLRSAEILGVQMAAQLERARLYGEANRLYADLKSSYDELERTQQELVRHERLAALGELAAVMAHEVRNPLGVIFNSLTTLKRLLRPSGDSEMLLNMVGEEADRLNRIVGDLLDFVRPYELVKKPVAVEPIIASAVDAASQVALHSSVRVMTEFPRELPPFPLDSHLLKQALVNLLVNAAQAMPRGGTVTVRSVVEKLDGAPWLAIEVKDEGVGLTPRAAEKMFQPFFTTKATGTGLGLAVVKRIVDAHLGEVTARANDDGAGTTFTVRFPPTTETRSGALTPPRPSPAFRRG